MTQWKKHIPTFLYGILLLIVAILCILVSKVIPAETVSGPEQDSPRVNNTEREQTSLIIPSDDQTDHESTAKPESVDTQTLKKYEDSVPRNAKKGVDYAFEQKIYGNGKTTLQDVIQTSVGIFVIVSSDSTEGDVYGSKPCLGIVKTDSFGNVLLAKSLSPDLGTFYITSAATAEGIVIATKATNVSFDYISIVPYDFSFVETYRIGSAKSGKIQQTSEGFLYFAEYEDETLVYTFQEGIASFQSIGVGTPIEIFEYDTYFLLYATKNETNAFTISKLSKQTLSVLSAYTRTGSELLRVFPMMENEKQVFLSLERRESAIWSVKYDSATFVNVLDAKRVGSFTLIDAYHNTHSLLLICEGNLTGTVMLDISLTSSIGSETNFTAEKVFDSIYFYDTVYWLAEDASDRIALIHTNTDSSVYTYPPIQTENAKLIRNLDGAFCIYYQYADDVKIMGLHE